MLGCCNKKMQKYSALNKTARQLLFLLGNSLEVDEWSRSGGQLCHPVHVAYTYRSKVAVSFFTISQPV